MNAEELLYDIFGYPAFFLYRKSVRGQMRWYRANSRSEAVAAFINGESIRLMDEKEQDEYERDLYDRVRSS